MSSTRAPWPGTSPGNVELAKGSHYWAEYVHGAVLFFAQGSHPVQGFSVFFELGPTTTQTPEVALWQAKPAGPPPHVETPFHVVAIFETESIPQTVIIHDSTGPNEIRVEILHQNAKPSIRHMPTEGQVASLASPLVLSGGDESHPLLAVIGGVSPRPLYLRGVDFKT